MEPVYVYTIFDDKTKKPRCTGILDGKKLVITELFRGKGSGNPLHRVLEKHKKVQSFLSQCGWQRPLVINNFADHIRAFELRYKLARMNIYNIDFQPSNFRSSDDKANVQKILEKFSELQPIEHQKLLANAIITYDDMSRKGLDINYHRLYPQWSHDTFSGRSKTSVVNIQGWHDHDLVRPPGVVEDSLLVHFDWICADIRVASIMSNDSGLIDSFHSSDPYQKMAETLGSVLTREECKVMLLKSLNSMDYTNDFLVNTYPDLSKWIRMCKNNLQKDGFLTTILGKKFKLTDAKNELAVFNAIMQGSVAHAMQSVLRRVWEKFPSIIVADIHDSLVVGCEKRFVKSIISSVAEIMICPFQEMLHSNPKFPLRVSVGTKWKKWKHVKTFREHEVKNV
jgi:hypothetical protein